MTGRCPTCGKAYEFQAVTDLPAFPFCSERCRLVDLGRWVDGRYVIPGTEAPATPSSGTGPDPDEDD